MHFSDSSFMDHIVRKKVTHLVMANGYCGVPLSYEQRKALFGNHLPICSIPVIDQSAGRYSTENRKPYLVQASRGLDWNLDPWRTTYQQEFRFVQRDHHHAVYIVCTILYTHNIIQIRRIHCAVYDVYPFP